MSIDEVIASLNFDEPRLVNTKAGERLVSNASPSDDFWTAWKTYKAELKNAGISVGKDKAGNWQVAKWELPNQEERQETLELSRATDLDVDIPAPTGQEYLGFQKAGIYFAKDKDTLIADAMGVGKTIQAIGVLNMHPEYRNVLVICPASLRLNWQRELNKWMVKPRTVGYVDRADYPEDVDVLIINYDIVEKHIDKLHARKWDLLIIDEAHYLKNPKAKRTKYILGSSKKSDDIPPIKARHKLFLTGTPILNRPIELFPLINALDPANWPSFWPYGLRYCNGHQNGYGWDFSGSSNLEELQERLRSTIMIRRLKEEVLTELPPKRRQVIELPATGQARKLVSKEKAAWQQHEEVIETLKLAVELAKVNGTEDEYREAVRALGEGIESSFTEMAALRQEIALEKVPYVVEHVKDIADSGEKVIIFAHHKSVVRALKAALGDEAVVLVGDTKIEDRQAAVDAFQTDSRIRYFIGSIKAASVGITLTAASNVVFAELDWVPGNLSQAEDRAARIGQRFSVLVQHLVLEDSLDVRMAQTLIDKQEIIDRALDVEVEIEPVVDLGAIKLPDYKQVEKETTARKFSEDEKKELLRQVQLLASYDADRAQARNDVGFNRFDSKFGHELAKLDSLSDKQAYFAEKLVHKYRRQLD